jgi:putative ABC transport system permease protein
VAFLLVLGLLITLFLRERKHEMGVYLALGEKRKNIIFQILTEVVVISSIAIVISLFIGNLLADHLSQRMIRNEMIVNATPQNFDMGSLNDLNRMGFGFWMTHEEMLEAYSVSLDAPTVFIFFGIATGMIILSTTVPTIYLTKLNLKDILTKASIG